LTFEKNPPRFLTCLEFKVRHVLTFDVFSYQMFYYLVLTSQTLVTDLNHACSQGKPNFYLSELCLPGYQLAFTLAKYLPR